MVYLVFSSVRLRFRQKLYNIVFVYKLCRSRSCLSIVKTTCSRIEATNRHKSVDGRELCKGHANAHSSDGRNRLDRAGVVSALAAARPSADGVESPARTGRRPMRGRSARYWP